VGSSDDRRDDVPPAGQTIELDARKERVLHTRVPESLDRQLKRRAQSLGMSVSTVVRHVLLNTFGLVEDIVTDSTNLALAITGKEPPPSADRPRATATPGDVVAWQEAVLNVNAVCERCNAILPRGTRAAFGVRDAPGPRSIMCAGCLKRLEGGDDVAAARRRR
jgi:hypothetical protein